MLVPLERRVAAGWDLEISREKADGLSAGFPPQERRRGAVGVGSLPGFVLARRAPAPGNPAELEDLRSIIHGNVVSPPRPPVLLLRSGRAARTDSRRSERSCPRRSAQSTAVPALHRSRLPAPETPVPPAQPAPVARR